tara:strand:+ start:420 stop:632 length:213 start_codon:yes stop_codon:yes gene_type:complete
MSLIKKYKEDESEKINFHIYDIIKNTPFIDRHEEVNYKLHHSCDYIQTVPTIQVKSEEQMLKRHSIFLEQ